MLVGNGFRVLIWNISWIEINYRFRTH